MDDHHESTNPYTPTAEFLERPARFRKRDRVEPAHLACLPGSMLGLLAVFAVSKGIGELLGRMIDEPIDACLILAGFSILAFGISMIYRLPRRVLIGIHRPWWLACFVGGFCMAFLFAGTMQAISSFGDRQSGTPWSLIFLCALTFAIVAVELEVLLSKRKFGISIDPAELETTDSV
jgi:drug/metabolite transporter (DMT)-like permease